MDLERRGHRRVVVVVVDLRHRWRHLRDTERDVEAAAHRERRDAVTAVVLLVGGQQLRRVGRRRRRLTTGTATTGYGSVHLSTTTLWDRLKLSVQIYNYNYINYATRHSVYEQVTAIEHCVTNSSTFCKRANYIYIHLILCV